MGIDAVLYETGGYDIAFDENGDVETADQLDTAILMTLFCERRAAANEMPVPELRRGWIGNEATPGFEIGSKLWLYEQARVTRTNLNGIEAAARDAMEWFLEDGLALGIQAEVDPSELTVTLERPNSEVSTIYYKLWEGTGV